MIAQSQANCLWIDHIFGPNAVREAANWPISCSGTTIGSHATILQYIDRLLAQATPEKMARLVHLRGHDQGIHNYLLGTGALPQAVLVPNGRHVYTVGFIPDTAIRFAPDGAIITPGGEIPAIVHQYTYKPAIQAQVEAAYPFPVDPQKSAQPLEK